MLGTIEIGAYGGVGSGVKGGDLRFIYKIEWHLKSGTSSASHPMAHI